jgi:hypothetical protein
MSGEETQAAAPRSLSTRAAVKARGARLTPAAAQSKRPTQHHISKQHARRERSSTKQPGRLAG